MKKFHTLIGIIVSFTLMTLISGCGGGSTTSDITSGTATMNITDAPVDDENVLGVHVAFDAVHYKPAGSKWVIEELNETRVINLLDLQDGNSTLLTSQTELPVGRINQIRLILNTDPKMSFVELAGDINETLTVPGQIEKVVGGFVVPAGGDINITADFDLRKALVLDAKGYKLKPTIKIVDNSQVGEVSGTVNVDGNTTVIVYAYADGDWNETAEMPDFTNAATSSDATDGSYTLAWLAAGTYDLVVVELDVNGGAPTVHGVVPDVVITEDGKATKDIDIQSLQ